MDKKNFLSVLVLAILLSPICGYAQEAFAIYHPDADAQAQIDEAVAKASAENKHVLLQIGGNWCGWCKRFYQLSHENASIDSTLKANYVVAHINYSKENKNLSTLAKLGYPQRFGFPVFVILNAKGERIHTQNSVYLEEDKGYDVKTIVRFLHQWSPGALKPEHYQ